MSSTARSFLNSSYQAERQQLFQGHPTQDLNQTQQIDQFKDMILGRKQVEINKSITLLLSSYLQRDMLEKKAMPTIYHSHMLQWMKQMIQSPDVQNCIQDCVEQVQHVMYKNMSQGTNQFPKHQNKNKMDPSKMALGPGKGPNVPTATSSSIKIINRDRVEIDTEKDLEQLRRLLMTMSINNNDRQQLINLYSQMATNKEIVYNETLKMQNGLNRLNKITDSLQSNQDMLSGMQEETRMIFRFIKDQNAGDWREGDRDTPTQQSMAGSPRNSRKSLRSSFSNQIGNYSSKNANSKQGTFVTGAVRVANSMDRSQKPLNLPNQQSLGETNDLKLMQFLREWEKDEPQTTYDLELYANELWMTTKQFEEDLKKHYSVYQTQIATMNRLHHKRETQIKEKHELYMEAAERAINQLKIDKMRIVEHYEMQICDYQSFIYNQHIPFDDINDLVRRDNITSDPDNPSETDTYIKSLQKCIRSLKLEVKRLETQNIYAKKEMKTLEDKITALQEKVNLGKEYTVKSIAQMLKFFNSIKIINETVGKEPLITFRDCDAFGKTFTETFNNVIRFCTSKLEQVSLHFSQLKKIMQDNVRRNGPPSRENSSKKVTGKQSSPKSSSGGHTPNSRVNQQNSDIQVSNETQSIINNEHSRTVKLIFAHYMGVETIDGKPRGEDGSRLSVIMKGPPLKKNTIRSNQLSKKSKLGNFGNLLSIPENDAKEMNQDGHSSSPQLRKSTYSTYVGSPGKKPNNKFTKSLKLSVDPAEKYKIEFEAYKDEDDRLTHRQSSYLFPFIENAFNMQFSLQQKREITNEISVEKLVAYLNDLMLSTCSERRKISDNLSYPLADILEIVKHKESGEVQGFQINSKMARLMFIKSLNDEIGIRDLLVYVIQLNRVFSSDRTLKLQNAADSQQAKQQKDQGSQTFFPDHFREKLRSFYLNLCYQLPGDPPFKYEKLVDKCETQKELLNLPVKHIYATNMKDMLNEDDMEFSEKKIKLNFEAFIDVLSSKLKDLISHQYTTQLEAFNKLREYEDKIENAGEELPKKGEKFEFEINFDELFMDERTLSDLKKTLARLTQKMSRRKAMNQSNENLLSIVGSERSGESRDLVSPGLKKGSIFQRSEAVVKAEALMAERYNSLMKPLDEVVVGILEEAEKNGIFIENTKIDQFLAAALREEDQSYAIETLTQFLQNLRGILSKHPEFYTILLMGKNNQNLGEHKVILSKEEKEQYYKAKIEDLEKLIQKQLQSQLIKGSKLSNPISVMDQKQIDGAKNSLKEQMNSSFGASMNQKQQNEAHKKKGLNARLVQQIAKREEAEKAASLEKKKTNLFVQSRKQANKFMLPPSDQDLDQKMQNQRGGGIQPKENDKQSHHVNDQRSRRRSILQSQIISPSSNKPQISFPINHVSIIKNDINTVRSSATQESTDMYSGGVLASQRSSVRDSQNANVISSEAFFDRRGKLEQRTHRTSENSSILNPPTIKPGSITSFPEVSRLQGSDEDRKIFSQENVRPQVLSMSEDSIFSKDQKQLDSLNATMIDFSKTKKIKPLVHSTFSPTNQVKPQTTANSPGRVDKKSFFKSGQNQIHTNLPTSRSNHPSPSPLQKKSQTNLQSQINGTANTNQNFNGVQNGTFHNQTRSSNQSANNPTNEITSKRKKGGLDINIGKLNEHVTAKGSQNNTVNSSQVVFQKQSPFSGAKIQPKNDEGDKLEEELSNFEEGKMQSKMSHTSKAKAVYKKNSNQQQSSQSAILSSHLDEDSELRESYDSLFYSPQKDELDAFFKQKSKKPVQRGVMRLLTGRFKD